ncbi:hypothetical protein [Pseudomonas lini]|uniref:hypothetical protein n=1 Tax=Pseudomonas lini TaxID=163011 RepID=UPI000AF433BE|nr:hypothetical protein [Pseudomonas lini]
MGRLLDLANRLAGAAVPSVPSLKFQRERLQPAPVLEVPRVPSAPPEKHKVEKPVQPGANDHPAQEPYKVEASRWLVHAARLLECSPGYLLERGFLTADDVTELCSTHPRFAACLIRSHPAWSPPVPTANPTIEQRDAGEPKHIYHCAATASPEWREARDQYHCHLFACRACFAPADRYCVTGVELRQQYNQTPMEPRP